MVELIKIEELAISLADKYMEEYINEDIPYNEVYTDIDDIRVYTEKYQKEYDRVIEFYYNWILEHKTK